MGKMKELFIKYQEEVKDDLLDDEYSFQQWVIEKEKEEREFWEQVNSGSIFPDGIEYDDEYYKSTYHPTKEEEDEAFKLFNKNK